MSISSRNRHTARCVTYNNVVVGVVVVRRRRCY